MKNNFSIKQLWNKYQTLFWYLFFGVCTTIVNIASYWLISKIFSTVQSTCLAWILSTTFAYFTNRKWVFASKKTAPKEILNEAVKFYAARIATGILDVVLMYILVDICGLNDVLIKTLSNVIVIVLNYVFSKLFIFAQKQTTIQQKPNIVYLKKTKQFLQKISQFFSITTVSLFFIIVFLLFNTGINLHYPYIIILLIIIIAIAAFLAKKYHIFVKISPKALKIALISLIVLGVLARFVPLFFANRFGPSDPLSDTGVHWHGAQEIFSSGVLGQIIGDYENLFSHLTSYTVLLSVSMRIFGTNLISVIFLNAFFDILSGVIIYFIIKIWRKKSIFGLIGAALWAINPIEIAFCSLTLPAVVVNFWIVLIIFLAQILFTKTLTLPKKMLLSIIIGLSLGLANSFRPNFAILLIAIIVILAIQFFATNQKISTAIAAGLIIVSYPLSGFATNYINSSVNPFYQSGISSGGWGFMVGANYESHGKWSKPDNILFFDTIMPSSENVSDAFNRAFKVGLRRYLDMTPNMFIGHLSNKTTVLFADTSNIIYDLPSSLHFKNDNKFYRLLQDTISLYHLAIVTLALFFIYKTIREKPDILTMFILLVFIGFFAASLLVEVMNRYEMPFIIIFIFLSSAFLSSKNDIINTCKKISKSRF